MKLLLGFLGAWTLWAVGHLISIPMCQFDALAWLYPTYNRLMLWSGDLQDWSGRHGPWDGGPSEND